MGNYIDLHLHLLPGLDDGPSAVEESAAIARGLAEVGFGRLVATPHRAAGQFEATTREAEAALAAVEQALDGVPGRPELGLAREYFFDRLLLEDLMEGRLRTLSAARKTFLFELPMDAVPREAREVVFRARSKGYRPVLAHPERNLVLGSRLDLLRELVDDGVALLVNLGSLAKLYGRRERKAGRKIVDAGLVTALASDTHGPPGVRAAADGIAEVERRWGRDAVDRLLIAGPRQLLGLD